MKFTCTAAIIEKIRALALDRLSASQIAIVIGAPTRNVVIGLAARRKIKLNGRNLGAFAPANQSTVRPPRTRAKRLPSRLLAQSISSLIPDEGIERVAQCPPVQKAMREERVAEPETNPVTILALRDGVCRWPLFDDPRIETESAFYCGAVTNSETYCSHHSAMASQHDYSHSERAAYRAKQRANA